ncbi:hypothetical protein C0Z17_18810 [Trinickia caryophylli]|nr:hypothetical protein C0Z17_18810 [Trinickia caryophylli]
MRQRIAGIDLNDPRLTAKARIWVPVLFGLWSVFLGQDRNWDGFNYHQYNGFALLHGKLLVDFAPAGMQTYFNPMLDVFYYGLNQLLPPPLVGFLLGTLHGTMFVLLLSVVKRVLPGLPAEDRYRTPLLLAAAGVLTANFLSGLGNSMGDDTTALFVLASVLVLLSRWERLAALDRHALLGLTGAGVLAGIAMGLKLTNATYALALSAACLLAPGSAPGRLRAAILFGVAALGGLLAAGGYWMAVMWHTFGNPFFPQFSSLFPNPLTPPIGVSDTTWLPKSVLEYALWPFVFSLDSKRVGQATLHQVIWPVVYLLFGALAAASLARLNGRRPHRPARLDSRAAFVLVFVALGYLAWMFVFSIYRYIVPIEVLAPLACYLLLMRLAPYATARRLAAWVLGGATAVVLAGGVETWGHERWAAKAFRADVPALSSPGTTTVVTLGGDPVWGWIVQFFPDTVAFTQINGSFPHTPLYDQRIADMIRRREGPAYAVIEGHYNWRADSVEKMDRIASAVGLTASDKGCALLQTAVLRLRLHASVRTVPGGKPGHVCNLGLRADDVRDIAGENARLVERAQPIFARHGLALDQRSCQAYRAYVGQGVFPYQWCRVALQ